MSQSSSQSRLSELLRAFYDYAGSLRIWIPFLLLAQILAGLFRSVIPKALGIAVDDLSREPTARFLHPEHFWWYLLAVVLLSFGYYGLDVFHHYGTDKLGTHTAVTARTQLYRHLQRLSADFYQRTHIGEITARLTTDVMVGISPLARYIMGMVWVIALVIPACVVLGLRSLHLLFLYLSVFQIQYGQVLFYIK